MRKIRFRINIKDNLKYLIPLLLMFFVAIGMWGSGGDNRNQTEQKITDSDFAFDTIVQIDLYGVTDRRILQGCFDLCEKYENLLSRTVEDSEIARLNRREISTVSDDTAEVIRAGLEYSAASQGTFDITLGGVTELWNFDSGDDVPPAAADIAAKLKHTGYDKVQLSGNEITFSDPETKLDLGGIAKGYIAAKIREYLLDNGVKHAIINLGGNVCCVGGKTAADEFVIGIQYPYEDHDEAIARLKISDKSVVTSGIYERYFEYDGKLYYHILDPATGYPRASDLLAVSIITPDATQADAYSTICFGLGLEQGMEFVESQPEVEAVFITKDYKVHTTSGLQDRIQITE